MVDARDLTMDQSLDVADQILRSNARSLYGLDSAG
jgi:hypothetical protein